MFRSTFLVNFLLHMYYLNKQTSWENTTYENILNISVFIMKNIKG